MRAAGRSNPGLASGARSVQHCAVKRLAHRGRSRAGVGVLVAALLAGPAQQAGAASTVKVNCGTQDLQTKIDAAQDGDTLLIRGTCTGTFTVDSSLILKKDPDGTTATLDAAQAGRTLSITGDPTVHLVGLTVTGGTGSPGGGIFKPGSGVLTLNRVTVKGNIAPGTDSAQGGGIYSADGTLTISSSTIRGNRAVATTSGQASAQGGGVWSGGPLTLTDSNIRSNHAEATSTGANAPASGGGVFVDTAPLTIASTVFSDNRAVATAATLSLGQGGAVEATLGSEALSVRGSRFNSNVARGSSSGSDSAAAAAGALSADFGTGSITGTTFTANEAHAASEAGTADVAGGAVSAFPTTKLTLSSSVIDGSIAQADAHARASGDGGGLFVNGPGQLTVRGSTVSNNTLEIHDVTAQTEADGGGILNLGQGSFSLVRSTISGNRVLVTSEQNQPVAIAGGLESGGSAITISASTISGNLAFAEAFDANTALAFTAGVEFDAPSTLVNSTITGNTVRAVASPSQGKVVAAAGGLEISNRDLDITNSTVARNHVTGSAHDMSLLGGGVFVNGTVAPTVEASLLALNTAGAGPDCFGNVTSAGFNLIKNLNGCTVATQPSDQTGVDPRLGTLADNGGPTRTLALLAGSPAANRIPALQCAVGRDQRGVKRPQGTKCDLGAFERNA
jgi:hypothetical protein